MNLSNNQRKLIHSLHQKKHRYESGLFIVEGIKGVIEAINAGANISFIVKEDRRESTELLTLLEKVEKQNIEVVIAQEKDVATIKTTDHFPGILAVVEMPEQEIDDMEGVVIALDRLNDPGNLGTIIRTADWFGIKHILLSEDCVDVFNPKVVRSTMGSVFRSNLYQSQNFSQDLVWLKETKGYKLAGLALDGKEISGQDKLNIEKNENVAFIFGSESHGIRPNILSMLDATWKISGSGGAESLNVAISAGIIMAQLLEN